MSYFTNTNCSRPVRWPRAHIESARGRERRSRRLSIAALTLAGSLTACEQEVRIDAGSPPDEPMDHCDAWPDPAVTLGHGVGGTFSPYPPDAVVSLTPAPQGGFGISSVLRTQGLVTGSNLTTDIAYVTIKLDVEIDGQNEGTFTVEEVSLLCSDPAFGGLLTGVVAGFDPSKYQDNDDLIGLDNRRVDIIATVTDEAANVATARASVIVRVGG